MMSRIYLRRKRLPPPRARTNLLVKLMSRFASLFVSFPRSAQRTNGSAFLYFKLSQLEHVLKRPDTYIGSVEPVTQPMWVYDQDLKSLVYRYVARLPSHVKLVSLTREITVFIDQPLSFPVSTKSLMKFSSMRRITR